MSETSISAAVRTQAINALTTATCGIVTSVVQTTELGSVPLAQSVERRSKVLSLPLEVSPPFLAQDQPPMALGSVSTVNAQIQGGRIIVEIVGMRNKELAGGDVR